jgi:phenylpyruvate tautomerase
MSIGKLGVQENKSYSKILGEHIEKHLGVSPSHMYIEYQDIKTADLGYDKTTFHDILG